MKSLRSTKMGRSSNEVGFVLILLRLVSRICAEARVNKLSIELDINSDIYPMEQHSFYKMVLATSVNADGSDTFDIMRYENEGSASGMGSLIDQYEYVMHGKIFKYSLEGSKL